MPNILFRCWEQEEMKAFKICIDFVETVLNKHCKIIQKEKDKINA